MNKLKFMIIVLALVFTTSVMALPQGKPFQELQASIDMIAGEVDSVEARVTQLEVSLNLLSVDVVKNAEAIDTINDELDLLNNLMQTKQDILAGSCPTGYALNYFDPEGVISCVSTGQAVDREVVSALSFVSPNRVQTKSVTCSPGYVLTGGTANYAGGVRGTNKPFNAETYQAINEPAPFFAFMTLNAFCIK